MGRIATCNIKTRKKISVYPSHQICEALQLQHIELQSRLGSHIDKTLHLDAILSVGMRHIDEVTQEIEKLTRLTQS
jgi:hypothetical protein